MNAERCALAVQELDFKHEASNAERCKQNFRSRHSQVGGKVYIPEVLHDLTTSRVLTMEFIRGRFAAFTALQSLCLVFFISSCCPNVRLLI